MLRKVSNLANTAASDWTQRYGRRHGLVRVRDFPLGIEPPDKVRIYSRADHHILQWWHKAQGRTVSERVEGDLLAAVLKSRSIDEQLRCPVQVGGQRRKVSHTALVEAYLRDLDGRVEAGEVTTRTRDRYASALSHYLAFVDDPTGGVKPTTPSQVDRKFALQLLAFLARRLVPPNGHSHATPRPLANPDYVIDTVRAMYEWAGDPTRGAQLPAGFLNPFLRSRLQRKRSAPDALAEPDITVGMAHQFFSACDDYALTVMAPVLFYGLRPSELIYLFRQHIDDRWVGLPCIEELGYLTKGARGKKFPRLPSLIDLWKVDHGTHGLVLHRRAVAEGRERPPLNGQCLDALIAEYRRRCRRLDQPTRRDFERCRDGVIGDAGGLTYGHVQREFRRVTRRLKWPREATLKDFRHLFNTSLANGGMPEHERRYLMGHAPGRDAIAVYTHLNRLEEHYHSAIQKELGGILGLLEKRLSQRKSDKSTSVTSSASTPS
jgi:integrase